MRGQRLHMGKAALMLEIGLGVFWCTERDLKEERERKTDEEREREPEEFGISWSCGGAVQSVSLHFKLEP